MKEIKGKKVCSSECAFGEGDTCCLFCKKAGDCKRPCDYYYLVDNEECVNMRERKK